MTERKRWNKPREITD